jgi:hypothetical protein
MTKMGMRNIRTTVSRFGSVTMREDIKSLESGVPESGVKSKNWS